MTENIAFRLVRGQLEHAIEIVEAWKAEHREAMSARDAEDITRYLLDVPAAVNRTCRSLLDEYRQAPVGDPNGTRMKLQMILDESLSLLCGHRESARRFETAGHCMAGAGELDKAIARLQELRQGLLQHWPEFTEKEMEEGRAEHLRGESLDVDEAFAQIAGVNKEDWFKNVQVHRQRDRSE